MTAHLILECNETECAASVEVEVVPGQPSATRPFEEQAPGWGWNEQGEEGVLHCPTHYRP